LSSPEALPYFGGVKLPRAHSVRLTWTDRMLAAICVTAAYFVAAKPLYILCVASLLAGGFSGNPFLMGAPYFAVPLPALIAVVALRVAKARAGGVSLVTVCVACSVVVLGVSRLLVQLPRGVPAIVQPSVSVGELLRLAFKDGHQRSFVEFMAAAFGGALVGSFLGRSPVGSKGPAIEMSQQ
jgi:hypothetical protein